MRKVVVGTIALALTAGVLGAGAANASVPPVRSGLTPTTLVASASLITWTPSARR